MNEIKSSSPPPLRDTLVAGSVWMVALKWVIRSLGALNIVILARLLTPADFGVVAMATVIVGLSKVFFELGVDYALIRDPKATEEDFHTAWSIRLLQSLALSLCLCLAAPFAVEHYNDSRVSTILYLLAVGVVIQGLTNIGIVSFRKELQFGQEFRFLVISKLVSTALTIALAFYFRSYWALVFGTVIANFVECALSYFFHPFRPRFSLLSWNKIWSFSKWIVVLQVSNYFMARFDRLLLGNVVSPSTLGHYTMGIEVSQMATTEVVAPVSRALVPGFAKLQVDEQRLRAAYLKTLGATAILVLPLAMGLVMVATEIVPIALGNQWHAAIPIVQLASVHLMFATLGSAASNISLVTGHIRKLVVLSVTRALIFVGVFYPVFGEFGITGVLSAKIIIAACMTCALIGVVTKTHQISIKAALAQLWRPSLAVAAMVAFIAVLPVHSHANLLIILASKVIVGAAIYVLCLFVLWRCFGGERAVESDILSLVMGKLGKKAS